MKTNIQPLIEWLKGNKHRLQRSNKNILTRTGRIGQFTIEDVKEARRVIRGEIDENVAKDIKVLKNKITNIEEDLKTGNAQLTAIVDSEIKTLEDLVEKCNIDLSKWDIVKLIHNYWGNENYPCWQVKAFLEPKKVNEVEIIEKILNNYKSDWKPISKDDILINDNYGHACCALMNITDYHLDKRTLSNKTIEERVKEYHFLVDQLLYSAYRFCKLEEIVYVVGSDFFHTDSYFNTTTRGTQLEVNAAWDKAYETGFDTQVKIISKLKQFCEKLTILHIRGNHDLQKSYYLTHALAQYFMSDPSIVFDRSSRNRKVFTYGKNFIGTHHGDCKINDLPLHFAKEFGEQFGKALYHEVIVGDKHFFMEKEIAGVRLKQLPSPSDTDQWHDDGTFINNTKSAICKIYRKDKPGRYAEFEESI